MMRYLSTHRSEYSQQKSSFKKHQLIRASMRKMTWTGHRMKMKMRHRPKYPIKMAVHLQKLLEFKISDKAMKMPVVHNCSNLTRKVNNWCRQQPNEMMNQARAMISSVAIIPTKRWSKRRRWT